MCLFSLISRKLGKRWVKRKRAPRIPVAIGATYSDADILVTGDREILEKITGACTTKKLLEKILPKNK